MAKKKGWFSILLSLFFSVMVKITSFFFDTVFALLRLIVRMVRAAVASLFTALKGELKKKEIRSQQPTVRPVYAPFQVLKSLHGNFQDFETYLLESQSSVGLIVGARGSGKSALGMRILENIAARGNRPVCAMGFLEESLPPWIIPVEKIEDVKNGSCILIDEGGILFSSRRSMSGANQILSEFLLITRHKDLILLFISQNSANLELNTLRQADYLLLRKPALLQMDFERKKIKEIYAESEKHFAEFPSHLRALTYVYSNPFRGFVTNELPGFWSEKTSKAFKDFKK